MFDEEQRIAILKHMRQKAALTPHEVAKAVVDVAESNVTGKTVKVY